MTCGGGADDWTDPVDNLGGNMTRITKPSDPTQYYTATYDAWNRFTGIVDGENTVAEYEYDGAKRRTIKKTYSVGVLDETRHFYHTEPSKWQVVEERVDSLSSADRQFVWGLRYVDDLVLRDRDTSDPKNGTLDERLYALQDANWNVTSIAGSDGTIQERYAYSAYGTPVVLTPAFASRATSNYAWETRFAGYRWDNAAAFYQVRNRVLDPCFGWLLRDLIGYEGGNWHLYEYVLGSPLNFLDASGETVTEVVVCAATADAVVPEPTDVAAPIKIPGWVCAIIVAKAIDTAIDVIIDWCTDKRKCKLIGSGGCNKKKGLKRCTYSCDGGPAEDIPIPCGPGNWDPPCPGWDGSIVEFE